MQQEFNKKRNEIKCERKGSSYTFKGKSLMYIEVQAIEQESHQCVCDLCERETE